MNKYILLLFCPFLLLSCNNIEKRKAGVLNYFTQLAGKTDQHFVSGQFIGWGKDASAKDINTIYEKSGQWVGFTGADYHNLDYIRDHVVHRYISCDLNTTNNMIVDYGVKFCFFSMHFNNPFSDSSAWDNKGDLKRVLSEQKIRGKLDIQMDSMAMGFEALQKKGIIVCLRAFHEMNGGWFWWGNKDSTDFIALYRYVHHYFTETKKLKNLLWCYSPCLWPVKYLTWYPGDDVVDIVCVDAYTDVIHPYFDQAYKDLCSINKPLGIGEFGPCDASDWEGKKPCLYDFDKFLIDVRQYYPRFVFFMTWDIQMSMAHHNKVKELLNDPWVVNKQQIIKAIK